MSSDPQNWRHNSKADEIAGIDATRKRMLELLEENDDLRQMLRNKSVAYRQINNERNEAVLEVRMLLQKLHDVTGIDDGK